MADVNLTPTSRRCRGRSTASRPRSPPRLSWRASRARPRSRPRSWATRSGSSRRSRVLPHGRSRDPLTWW